MQKRHNAAVGCRHDAHELLGHVGRLYGREPQALDPRPLKQEGEEPRKAHLPLAAPPPVIAEVDAGEDDLMGASSHGGPDLAGDAVGIKRAGLAAGFPDDAVRAAVVAAVLYLYARARTASRRHGRVDGRGNIGFAQSHRACFRKPDDEVGDLALVRHDANVRGERRELIGEKRRHAPRRHHERPLRARSGVPYGLAGLRLGLTRDGAGVDDDVICLGLAREHKARGLEPGRH